MQERSDELTTQTTGRGYNRQATDRERADTSVASDLYSPVPGDDDNTRPGMVGERTSMTTTRATDAVTDRRQDWNTTTTPTDTYTMRSRSESDNRIMQTIHDNPLAVVAAATAGGMLLGRMMRNRNQRNDQGYLRAAPSNYGYQGYQPSYGYQQPSFRPYGDYQPAPGFHSAPQYRSEQEFHPEQQFEGRHENFRSGSHWD